MSYRNLFTPNQTRQTEKAHPEQVQNSAGGFSFAVDKWGRLDRFLVLGSDAPTYYASARTLTKENAQSAIECIKEDGKRVVDRAVEISVGGRAPKNDPALFVLALCAAYGSEPVRQHAFKRMPEVARTGTHLFQFVNFADGLRRWGRAMRTGIGNWYMEKPVDRLAYQVVKYQSRERWSHRDVLRKTHPKPDDEARNALFQWITQGTESDNLPEIIHAYRAAHQTSNPKEWARLVREHNLTREMLPTEALNDIGVWEALLERMPMTAMIRNLGKMTNIGLIKPMSQAEGIVTSQLGNTEALLRSRVHPLSVLVAMNTYKKGSGIRGSLSWKPSRAILDALDGAFYSSFGTIEPAGKRTMLALDVSGSMGWSDIAGMTGITPRVGAAAMAMATARTESQWLVTAFSTTLTDVAISPRQRLDDVLRVTDSIRMGGTDCALPMIHALNNGLEIDTFVVYTDNETWAGSIHPHQALSVYRQKTGIPAKLVVVGMISNGFTIADPNDAGMLDVVGFDTAAPNIISQFSRGA